MDYLDKPDPQTFIAHHGIKGQKWGVRRFQNADGSLTKAGKERYNEQNSYAFGRVYFRLLQATPRSKAYQSS